MGTSEICKTTMIKNCQHKWQLEVDGYT